MALTLASDLRVPSVCAIEEDGVLASFAEDKRIVAGTTTEMFCHCRRREIVASTAVEGVVASTASDSVGNAGADEVSSVLVPLCRTRQNSDRLRWSHR